jgi:diguanylate cyclase (GGDEF)-like protein
VFLLRSPLIARLAWPTDEHVFASAWLTVISTESLLATISTAFILLALAKERAELRHKTAATKDPLTGLANRRSFFQEAARLMQTSNRPVALLMIDLDHFKSINDQFGHTLGDEVLRIFAKTASANLRPSDLVGRLGGEEFAILLPAASHEVAWLVAERLRCAFAAAAATVDGVPIHATASIGLSILDPGQDMSALLDRADQALYRAKAGGRDRVVGPQQQFSPAA